VLSGVLAAQSIVAFYVPYLSPKDAPRKLIEALLNDFPVILDHGDLLQNGNLICLACAPSAEVVRLILPVYDKIQKKYVLARISHRI
jgi:hypothetical protein